MYAKRITLFLVSALLLAALLYSIDYDEFFKLTSKISITWIILLVVIQLVTLFLMSLRWYVIIRRYGVSLLNVVYTSFIGFMINSLTPMSIAGGEPVRAYVISKIDKVKTEKAFATVFVDMFISLLPALFINLIALVLVFKHSLDLRIALVLAIVAFIILTLLAAAVRILMRKEPSMEVFNKIIDIISRIGFLKKYALKIESQVDELFTSFHKSIRNTVTNPKILGVGVFISSLAWILSFIRVYLIFIALGIDIDFEIVVIVYAILVTISILPLLPGALGMWEWIGTGLFNYFGVPFEAAVAIVMVDRLLFYWLPIFLGFLSSLHVGLNVMKLLEKKNHASS